jgi:hypothetical protein
VLCAAVMLSGCRFWYKPIPVANAIGEEEVALAGDTVNVYRETRFEVYGPSSEAVYDGYEQLNRSYRAFERHFSAAAPRLAVIMYRDSVIPLDAETLREFRGRGFQAVQYARPRSVRSRRRYTGSDYGGVDWPIAPTAARVMLARFIQGEAAPPEGQRSDSAVLERIPAWYRAAVIHLVGEAGAIANDIEYVREKRHLWWQFRDLLTLARPASADSLLDPSRRGEAEEGVRVFAAQSSAIGRFLVEREGPAVLGRLGRGYSSGRALTEMLAEFKAAPRTVSELEQRWKAWIETLGN